MTIKETILPLADSYAASALVAPFSDANAHDATQARAALVAALDAADRELVLAKSETATWRETVKNDQDELKTVWGMNEALKAENTVLRVDAERMDYMQNHLLRKATMRFDMEFKEVNAWTIASANTNLREAIDAARAALGEQT
jgi:hypothetical protein